MLFYVQFHIKLVDLLTHCKAACEHFAEKNENIFEVIVSKWSILTEIKNILQIPAEATVVIQNPAFTLSDFFVLGYGWKCGSSD